MRETRTTSLLPRPGITGAIAPVIGLALLVFPLQALAGPPPGTPIDNVANGAGTDSLSGAALAAASNTVTAIVGAGPVVPPTLVFHANASYAAPTTAGTPGQPLFLEAVANGCDLDPFAIDSVVIALTVDRTGDGESVVARETAPASGRFRAGPIPTADGAAGVGAANGVVEALRNDHVVATLAGCGAPFTQAHLWFEPAGIVFDSRDDTPVAGMSVTLIDELGSSNGGSAGAPATVFESDGVTPVPNPAISDAAGRYRFPSVAPGIYRLALGPAAGWTFPSTIAPGALPAGHVVDAAGSYGGDFAVAIAGAPVAWDVPLDRHEAARLYAEISASRPWVEPGDHVDLTIRFENRSDSTLSAATLDVQLPHAFGYVPGTHRVNGAPAPDPSGGRGPLLQVALGTLGPRAQARVVVRVHVGADVPLGEAIARAQGFGPAAVSNVASTRLDVVGGVFAGEAMLSGTIYVDRDRDGRRSAADPGMPGVRLWLDDGTFAVTDPDGEYSFYGLTPRTHTLRVDPTSLPAFTRFVATDRRESARGGTRFVDLQRGDFQRADLALAADSTTLIAAAERRASHDRFTREIERSLRENTPLDGPPMRAGDPRSRPPSGIAEGGERLPLFEPTSAKPVRTEATLASADGFVAAPLRSERIPLETLLPTLIPVPAFVDLADRDTLPVNTISVRVQGPFGQPLELRVNGAVIPESRVGLRVASAEMGVQAWEYIGVRVEPGLNLLEVSNPGAMARAAVRVIAPDALGRLVVSTGGNVQADGQSIAVVRVRAIDPRGVTVSARTFVTLFADLGRWDADDLDPDQPGLQAVIEGGVATFGLIAPTTPGTVVVRARSGETRGEASLEFLPALRPLLALGSFEGVVSLSDLTRGPRAPRRPEVGFEAPVSFFADERSDGRANASARAALFVKGRVHRDLLLTLGFDSDRPENMRQFRDVQPADFYPVYGDASVRGYEAQSTGRLYARLERHGASLLYGDFVTMGTGGAQSLASYSRSLTGVQSHIEERRVRVDAFTSRERTRRRVDEIAGLGMSGPYQLSAFPIVENSERVELVTRDRDQTAVVLASVPQTRFADYDIDPLTGRLLFTHPVPSFTAELNPVSVRVSYEVDSRGEGYWTSGVEGRLKVTERLEVGGTYVDELEPGSAYELRGAFVGARLSDLGVVEFEYAATHRTGEDRGHGGRFEFRHEDARTQARLFGALTDTRFSNPTAGFMQGRGEGGGRVLHRLDERTQLRGEALYSEDAGSLARRAGMLLGIDRTLSRALKGEAGVRVALDRDAQGLDADPLITLRGRLQRQWRPELSGYIEAEHDVRSPRRLAALGGEYRFFSRGRLYTRHEFISSIAGPFAMQVGERRLSNVVGMDADVGPDAHVFSEYRMGDALAGREAEAAVGLRNAWRVGDGLRLGASFERVSPLGTDTRGPVTAITTSLDYRESADWKGSARYEVRTSRSGDSFLATMAVAGRVDSAWTALCRNILGFSDEGAAGYARERFLVGLTYRPTTPNAWETLARYELRFDREQALLDASRRRVAHVVSLHTTGRLLDHVTPSLGVAGKTVADRADGLASRSRAAWVHGRLTWDFARVWDAGLTASTLFGGTLTSRRDGAGVELGRMMRDGVWLSAGWNYFGYEDPDLPDETWTRRGVYLRVRARFDEELLLRGTRSVP